jgi:hypothetical protein
LNGDDEMRVWLREKGKTSVPVMVEAVNIRYSKRRDSLVIDGYFKWYEILMSVEEAQKLMDKCVNENKNILDLRELGALGFFQSKM